MFIRAFKYLTPLPVFIAALYAFTAHGIYCYIPLIYAWIVIPVLELLLPPDTKNMNAIEEDMAKKNPVYDFILYFMVLLQVFAVFYFLYHMRATDLSILDKTGRIGSMGLLCGTFGINIGHELGHRKHAFEQTLAKIALLTSLYMHFFIEHNKGHHKMVATPNDPSSARYGEPLYFFWPRTILFTHIGAWHIANDEQRKKGKPALSADNQMLQMQMIQLLFIILLIWMFSWQVTLYFLMAAFMGILLLETVNYIEHYGLSRKSTGDGKFERAMPEHSWNSNHVIGRLMLFELSRHSDHHYAASRKYQILRHHTHAPQMPTGYPGMMILSLVPPLWFYIMNRRIKNIINTASPSVPFQD